MIRPKKKKTKIDYIFLYSDQNIPVYFKLPIPEQNHLTKIKIQLSNYNSEDKKRILQLVQLRKDYIQDLTKHKKKLIKILYFNKQSRKMASFELNKLMEWKANYTIIKRREKEDIDKAVKIWLISQEIFPESDLIRKISTFMKVTKSTLSYRISRLDVDYKTPTRKEIFEKANDIIIKRKNNIFKAYDINDEIQDVSWVDKWGKRNKCFLKKSVEKIKEKPKPKIQDIVLFFTKLCRLVSENNYSAGFIFNMDKTTVYNNTNRERLTVVTTERNEKPIRKIPVLNFHLTAVVCISNDGSSLPSLMIDRKKNN
ncbi:hypothetical protein M0812_15450 [Anaeramoeba flamelloides]|uniref:Uncharacterized protein n=1 Tax=Anaeramoeba flamelloides TaxID=1746091 RepID=A0AAV7ZC14_9EUKA|nr:hypothetical protein M0812_15450 [Anaeramoeba flamelloides]